MTQMLEHIGMLARGEHGEALRPVALTGVRVAAELRDLAARVTLTQTFRNTEGVPIEALYCFPLEEGSTVCAMRVRTAGRTLVAVAQEKDRAFKTYDDAMSAGHGAWLLDMEREDILTVSAGNLAPGQEAEVEITTVSALPVADGVRRFQLPTTVSPRYAPADSDPVDTDRISPPVAASVPYRLRLDVRVLAEEGLQIRSPSHEIAVGDEGRWRLVTLAQETSALDRDFVLETVSPASPRPVCLVSTHANGDRAALLRLFPVLDELEVEPVVAPAAGKEGEASRLDVVFIVDCSGSMQGSSIDEARKTLDLSLRSMAEGDRFDIVRFGSTMDAWRPAPVEYNERTFREAVSWVRAMQADLGGTELLPAFEHVVSMPLAEGARRDIVLITDGEVANPDEVIAVAAHARGRQRVFSFGIGYGASSALVKGVARASGGASEMLQPGEKIQQKVLRQFSRLGQPAVENPEVKFSGATAELAGGEAALPPLFEGDSFVAFARVTMLTPGAQVTVSGTVGGRKHCWSAPLEDAGEDDTIPCLWAREQIRSLQSGTGEVRGSQQVARRASAIQRQIVDLGVRFNLLTDSTSFVAVEEREEKDRTTDRAELRRVPVMLTRDWGGSAAEVHHLGFTPMLNQPAPRASVRASAPLGIRKVKMRSLSAPAGASSAEPDPWYLRLLATQDSRGAFMGFEIIAEKLAKSVKELESLAESLEGTEKPLRSRALATWLAVMLLRKDPDAAQVSRRAIRKAEKWLATHAAALTIGSKLLSEIWK